MISQGKREGIPWSKGEQEKQEDHFLKSLLTLHTAARACTNEAKRFPGWSQPPNLRYDEHCRTSNNHTIDVTSNIHVFASKP